MNSGAATNIYFAGVDTNVVNDKCPCLRRKLTVRQAFEKADFGKIAIILIILASYDV